MQRRGMGRDHPPRRSWMQGLRGKVRNPASPSCWDNWDKPEESHQGAGGGGREGKLLVVATEEGQKLGLGTPVRAAAGGGGETSPQATAPPPGDVLDRGRNVHEGWHQLMTLQLTQRCTGGGAAGRNVKQETPSVY